MSEKGIQSLPADVTRQLQVLTRVVYHGHRLCHSAILLFGKPHETKTGVHGDGSGSVQVPAGDAPHPDLFQHSDPACPYLLCGPLWENRLSSKAAGQSQTNPHLISQPHCQSFGTDRGNDPLWAFDRTGSRREFSVTQG